MNETPTLYLRRAHGAADVDLIYRWRAQVVEWLTRRHPGVDQWRANYPRANIERWVRRGETYMASLTANGWPVATVTSSSDGDPALWTPDELAVPARYVSKLTVDRRWVGRRIGLTLVDWARHDAARAGAEVVRIDVFSGNRALQDLYLGYGFRHVRTDEDAPYNSGALFEIPAELAADLPVVELLDPFRGAADAVSA